MKILSRLGTFFGWTLSLVAVMALTLVVFRLPVGPSFGLLFEGAFGDKFAWSRTALKAVPLLFTGLGMVVAWRARAYNIGGEGQFILGGLAGAWVWKLVAGLSISPLFQTGLILIASILGGAAWALVSGWLQVRRGVDIVISTILLNFVAIQALGWLVSGPLQEVKHALPQTDMLPDAVMLYKPDRQLDLNAGVLLALACAFLVYVYLFHTKEGFKVRLVGENAAAARANCIESGRSILQAMVISGALCGLAGGVEYVGSAGLIDGGFSQNWGFLGIPVALLAGLDPLVAILSAFYFGALMAGSENLGRFTQGGPTLVYVVQSAAVLAFVALGALAASRWRFRIWRPAWIR